MTERNDIVRMPDGLMALGSKSAFSLRMDASSSIRRLGLFDVLVRAVEGIERAIAATPGNTLTRSTFNAELKDLDVVDSGRGKQLRFTSPTAPDFVPFRELYNTAFGTHLDEAMQKDTDRLLRRHHASSGKRQYGLLLTDGVMFPGHRASGPTRDREIRDNVSRILAIANEHGGILQSPLAMLYVGIGGTMHDHLDMAMGRYGMPKEWVLWRPATEEGVRDAGLEIEKSVSDISMASQTGFRFDDDDEPDYMQTGFNFE